MRTTGDKEAFRDHSRKVAAREFNEVIRRNTSDWDGPPMTDDQRAYTDYDILRAAEKFHESTRNDEYDYYPGR